MLCLTSIGCGPALCQNKKPVKLFGRVDEVNYALGAAGVTMNGDRFPSTVGNVRLGSPAYYAGLQEDDKVLSGAISQNKLQLLIERKGKKYSISLATAPVDLTRQTAKTGSKSNGPLVDVSEPVPKEKASLPVKEGEPDKRHLEKLGKYDIVIVVDASGSMNDGLSTIEGSKWAWCEKHISTFAQQIRPYLSPRGITLVTFNNAYEITPSCPADRVEDVFKRMAPAGGTNMGSPLEAVFSDYFTRHTGQPLFVVVMTDGIPTQGPKVEDVIINATQGMRSPDQIKMTFLEIGEEPGGASLLTYLDHYLVHDGAKYDIITSRTFDQLKQEGLVGAMLNALQDKQPVSNTGKDLQDELTRLKRQIDAARSGQAGKKR